MSLIETIISGNYAKAKGELYEAMDLIRDRKLVEVKKIIGARMDMVSEAVDEMLDEARIKIVKVRIRQGKIQRRKKVSNVKGYTFRGGKLTRMSPTERRRRRMGQRRGKIKRRAKLARTRIKMKRSLRRRASLGI